MSSLDPPLDDKEGLLHLKLTKSQLLYQERKSKLPIRIIRTPCEVLVDMYPSLTPIWEYIVQEYLLDIPTKKQLPWVRRTLYNLFYSFLYIN
jgi:hypothetical protein